ncbi:toxin VasX [Ralstonia sp.]|uniref:toxin VasX n=1 Tax=Ralstonia sp. TaxID=54061 RepID=UPI0031DA0F56
MPDHAKLQKAVTAAKENNLPVQPPKCPSCDKSGLTMLVTLYAALPPQYFRPGESDWIQLADMLDQQGYLAGRPLQASQYVLRRMRAGWLYVYYPEDPSWEIYTVQPDGRMQRMAPDLAGAMGGHPATCSRLANTPDALLLTIAEPTKRPTAWIGFSDARWTKRVRDNVAKDPAAFHMKKIMPKKVCESTVMANMGPLSLIGDGLLKNQVMGFQQRVDSRTLLVEAYGRPDPCTEASLLNVMKRNNAPYKIEGLLLPLEDDIGIATQLNHYRNCALADIMGNTDGKGKPYSNADRDLMATAGLIESTPFGNQQGKVKAMLDSNKYEEYLEKYHRCAAASADFDKRSTDYVAWMRFVPTRRHPELFDQTDTEMAALFGQCVANLYEGCGISKDEFEKVLLAQLMLDTLSTQQLFWRGIAANQDDLLTLLSQHKGKVGEATKIYVEGREQIGFLSKVRELRNKAALKNSESSKRLMQAVGSRARQLFKADPKLFRLTFRRIQAAALTAEDVAFIQVPGKGGPTALLTSLRRKQGDAKGLSVGTPKTSYNRPLPADAVPDGLKGQAGGKIMTKVPKTTKQIDEYFDVLGKEWRKGETMPTQFNKIAEIADATHALPEREILEIKEDLSLTGAKVYAAASAGLAVMRIFSLVQSLNELGVDIGEAQSGDVNLGRLAKDLGEATASAFAIWQAGYELKYVAEQVAHQGVKTPEYYRLTAVAGRLVMAVSVIEGSVGILDGAKLWREGDRLAGGLKMGAGGTGAASGVAYYAYTRMVANAALKAMAERAALTTVGEAAAGLAVAGETAAVGAEVSLEAPPVAMWIGIASAALTGTSWVLGYFADRFTTSPFEKWADRCMLGSHSNPKWGGAYSTTRQQLDALLRLFYSVKLEKASAFGNPNAMKIEIPVFGDATEMDIQVKAPKSSGQGVIARYQLSGAGRSSTTAKEFDLENVIHTPASAQVHARASLEGDGLSIMIWIGGGASLEDALRRQAMTDAIFPAAGIYRSAKALIQGVPGAEVQYWPNRAAYKDFVVDGRSADEVAESKEKEPAHG